MGEGVGGGCEEHGALWGEGLGGHPFDEKNVFLVMK